MSLSKPNQRTCIGCQKKADRLEFLRLVYRGQLMIDESAPSQTLGRGVYLCPQASCLEKAIRKRALSYRLKQKLSAEEIDQFQKEFVKKLRT